MKKFKFIFSCKINKFRKRKIDIKEYLINIYFLKVDNHYIINKKIK